MFVAWALITSPYTATTPKASKQASDAILAAALV
jgi:hypothetical protein